MSYGEAVIFSIFSSHFRPISADITVDVRGRITVENFQPQHAGNKLLWRSRKILQEYSN